jgi:predicted MFS family arabinose efflux permease
VKPAATTSPRLAVQLFLAFAFAYFFSALLRAVTATLAPAFSAELGLSAGDLGLLAGAYFAGFAATQLPLGSALDRWGPRRVQLVLLAVAALSCVGFALARSFSELILARAAIGVGVSACLMAPLTAYRHRYSDVAQLRANSWMLMTGSFGMLASTLPVQLLLPALGWRGLFAAVALLLLAAIALIARWVPPDTPAAPATPQRQGGYREIFRHPTFVRLLPMGFFHYGGLVAVQSLWAGPWLTDVTGASPRGAAAGLFAINLAMLFAFLGWGLVMPRLAARGWTTQRLIARGVPISLALLVAVAALGPAAGAGWLAAWCVSCTVVSLSQPTVGQAFGPGLAGRALSAYNLVLFAGVFSVQWGIGLAIDALVLHGWPRVEAYRAAVGGFAAICILSYLWFLRVDDRPSGA